MKRRLNLSQAVVAPWEIPDIAVSARTVPDPDFLEVEIGQRGDSRESVYADKAADAAGVSAIAEAVDSQGHAKGFETGLREGRERGHAEGLIAGRQAADLQSTDQLRRLETVIRRLGEPTRSLERPVEEAVIAFALEVARWVIGSEVSRSRDYLVQLIRDAVARVPIDVGTPTIVLNHQDIEVIRRLAPDLEFNGIGLIADETVEVGGCRVIANGVESLTAKDRRWHPRALQGICEVDLTLASRWREAMFAMFEGEDT